MTIGKVAIGMLEFADSHHFLDVAYRLIKVKIGRQVSILLVLDDANSGILQMLSSNHIPFDKYFS